MNRRRNLAISLVAALLSGALVYCVYELQLRQIELQETAEVIVPLRFIAAGERLTGDDLGVAAVARASVTAGMLRSKEEAVGMETALPLGQGEPILDWKLDKFRLLPGRNESTFQIPKPYVLSVSSGIRAGDRVLLYASGESGESRRLFPEPVTVASVKTSGNLEIDDPANSHLLSMASGDRERMYAARRDANGMIDAVNLNLTEEQWLAIDRLCKTGDMKLVIAYSSDSLAADPVRAEVGPS